MSPKIPCTQNLFIFSPAILISAVIIILWLIPALVTGWKTESPGTGVWGFVSIVALVATIISPLIYGWYSRDGTGAILIGVFPFLLVAGVSRIISGPSQPGIHYLAYSVLYIVSLNIIGGLEGFFYSKEKGTFARNCIAPCRSVGRSIFQRGTLRHEHIQQGNFG